MFYEPKEKEPVLRATDTLLLSMKVSALVFAKKTSSPFFVNSLRLEEEPSKERAATAAEINTPPGPNAVLRSLILYLYIHAIYPTYAVSRLETVAISHLA